MGYSRFGKDDVSPETSSNLDIFRIVPAGTVLHKQTGVQHFPDNNIGSGLLYGQKLLDDLI
jgi:ribosomal protein L27